jgi:hypothetical protein
MLSVSGNFNGSAVDFYVMTHKSTGDLRFSSSSGSDSTVYDGNTISLNKRTLKSFDHATANTDEVITVSSSPEDTVPYKMTYSFTNGDDVSKNVSFSLKMSDGGIYKLTPGPYTKSDDVGKGYKYTLTVGMMGVSVSGTATFLCIAEGASGSNDRFVMMETSVSGVKSAHTWMYGPYTLPAVKLTDRVLEAFKTFFNSPAESLTGSEKLLRTIDGDVDCNVYTVPTVPSSDYKKYVGQVNGLLYQCTETSGGISKAVKLSGYLSY